MPFNVNKRAELSVDEQEQPLVETAESKTPATPRQKSPADAEQERREAHTDINWESPSMCEHLKSIAEMDVDTIHDEIELVPSSELEIFKHYCETFDSGILPVGVRAWFDCTDDRTRTVWLFERFKCMGDHLFLATNGRGRLLSKDNLWRVVHLVLNHPHITNIRELPEVGPLTDVQVAQVKSVFTKPTETFEYQFPDFCARFREEAH